MVFIPILNKFILSNNIFLPCLIKYAETKPLKFCGETPASLGVLSFSNKTAVRWGGRNYLSVFLSIALPLAETQNQNSSSHPTLSLAFTELQLNSMQKHVLELAAKLLLNYLFFSERQICCNVQQNV